MNPSCIQSTKQSQEEGLQNVHYNNANAISYQKNKFTNSFNQH
jgi:hypothetical protein